MADVVSNGVPIGTVVAYAGEIVDNGQIVIVETNWLLCNGAALKSTQYNELYQHIRTAHGNASNDADPATDFNLPDYRGLFLRGVANTRSDRDPNTTDRDRPYNNSGGNTGNRVGSVQSDATKMPNNKLTIGEVAPHSHTDPTYNGLAGSFEVAIDRGPAGVDYGQGAQTSPAGEHTHAITGGDNETRPINAYVNYIIRAK